MPSLIFLIPVLSSTMDPVARVVIETFLDDIFLDDDENTFEETLLLPARDADMDRTEAIILLVLCGSATKKKELCFVVGDVLRRATSRAKCNEDVWCRKKTKEGNTTNRRKKKGEDVTLFLPLKYILRDVERETAKKKPKRERETKRFEILKRNTRV